MCHHGKLVLSLDDTGLPFLSFSNEKQQLRRYLDGVSNTIYIPIGFPIGFETHTGAYVSDRYLPLSTISALVIISR